MHARSPKLLPVIALALVLGSIGGCGTIKSRNDGSGGVYSGVGYDLERFSSGEEWSNEPIQGQASSVPFFLPRALLWLLDTPFSFVADTLLLPLDALSRDTKRPEDNPTCSTNSASHLN